VILTIRRAGRSAQEEHTVIVVLHRQVVLVVAVAVVLEVAHGGQHVLVIKHVIVGQPHLQGRGQVSGGQGGADGLLLCSFRGAREQDRVLQVLPIEGHVGAQVQQGDAQLESGDSGHILQPEIEANTHGAFSHDLFGDELAGYPEEDPVGHGPGVSDPHSQVVGREDGAVAIGILHGGLLDVPEADGLEAGAQVAGLSHFGHEGGILHIDVGNPVQVGEHHLDVGIGGRHSGGVKI